MATLDQAHAVRDGESLDVGKIVDYLRSVLPDLDGPASVEQFHSGYSNLTYLVRIGDRQMVLRRPPFGKKARSAHDMGREYRILKALKPVFPYVPEALAYCDDPAVMDVPFYVMERLEGVILRKDPPGDMALDASRAAGLCRRWIGILGSLHALDYEACGLADLGSPDGYAARQVKGWCRRYRDARTPDVPDFEAVMAWLTEKMPEDQSRSALIHNDYKFDNVILDPADPTRIIGLLDWEMATIGDPLLDLGAALGYWVESGDSEEMKMIRTLPTVIPGMLTRRQVVERYAAATGIAIDGFAWYYAFGLFRLAVIAQQIYYRFYHGQTRDKRFGMLGVAVGILEKAAVKVMVTGAY